MRLSRTVRLDERVGRVAEALAARYRVTVAELVEALLLGCAERDALAPPAGAPDRVRMGPPGPARPRPPRAEVSPPDAGAEVSPPEAGPRSTAQVIEFARARRRIGPPDRR